MRNMASCDAQGAVFITDDTVYRLVPADQKEAVTLVLDKINKEEINGIVQTEKCFIAPEEIKYNRDALLLKHKKINFISYPHEWCASMLKDAALFHLNLSEQLFKHDIFIKDAHPWNILFEKNKPLLIDFTSIASIESLFSENYLESNKTLCNSDTNTRLAGLLSEIFTRMYLPYFFTPLAAYSLGNEKVIRRKIRDTTLNVSDTVISIGSCFFSAATQKTKPIKIINIMSAYLTFKKTLKTLTRTKNISNFYKQIKTQVEKLNVTNTKSPYLDYYKEKDEYLDWVFSEYWNSKQKSVYEALQAPEINTVLDVACNTGWFAILAEKLGKAVVAFDIDEACIENLYARTKKHQLNILPLILDLTDLTEDRFSIHDGKIVLINTAERLKADSVIALGILHHLTLGLGLSFDQVLDTLTPLARKQLVIEYVDARDPMVINEPEFFSSYFRNPELVLEYSLDKFLILCQKRGFIVECKSSYPDTRTIIVCRQQEEK